MATIKITKRNVDAAAVPDGADAFYWDTELKGFGLRVTPRAVRSFVFQYRLKGRAARRLTIGRYGSLTPEQARSVAQSHALSVAQGRDPVEVERKKARDARVLEFSGYLSERFTEGCLKEEWPDSWEEAKRTLERHVLPHFKGKALPEISADHIKDVIDPLRPRKPIARKVWAILSRLFTWAIEERDLAAGSNPMAGVRPPPAPEERRRVLSPDEIVAAWKASFDLHPVFGMFVRMLFCTLQRRNEVAGLPWYELDKERSAWIIDAKRAKNDEDHVCPLNALAQRDLGGIGWKRRGLVFTTNGETPISGFSRMKKKLDAKMLPILQQLADQRAEALGEETEAVILPRWTLHDIRRTGSTQMQALGIAVEVADRVLNHQDEEASRGSRRPYFLWKYEPEKRAALEKWGAHLERLIAGAEASKVVQLATKRAKAGRS